MSGRPIKRTLRDGQRVLVQRKAKTVLVVLLAHRSQAVGHPLRVAVLAPSADLRAASHRIPCSLRPLNARAICHFARVYTLSSYVRHINFDAGNRGRPHSAARLRARGPSPMMDWHWLMPSY